MGTPLLSAVEWTLIRDAIVTFLKRGRERENVSYEIVSNKYTLRISFPLRQTLKNPRFFTDAKNTISDYVKPLIYVSVLFLKKWV